MAIDCSKNKIGKIAAKSPTGKINFQSRQKQANKTKNKLDKVTKPDTVSRTVKVSKDKEKIKSVDLKIGLSWEISKAKANKNKGAKVSFLSIAMIYSS